VRLLSPHSRTSTHTSVNQIRLPRIIDRFSGRAGSREGSKIPKAGGPFVLSPSLGLSLFFFFYLRPVLSTSTPMPMLAGFVGPGGAQPLLRHASPSPKSRVFRSLRAAAAATYTEAYARARSLRRVACRFLGWKLSRLNA